MSEQRANEMLRQEDERFITELIKNGAITEAGGDCLKFIISFRRSLTQANSNSLFADGKEYKELVQKSGFRDEDINSIKSSADAFFAEARSSQLSILEMDFKFMIGMSAIFMSRMQREELERLDINEVSLERLKDLNAKNFTELMKIIDLAQARVPIFPEQVIERMKLSDSNS
ncbi:MAG TPA: hypothetical protein VG895_05060 [Patescibacteria group bacterium]|nr:hypothetical protein [Patescibacteria group bacterium]